MPHLEKFLTLKKSLSADILRNEIVLHLPLVFLLYCTRNNAFFYAIDELQNAEVTAFYIRAVAPNYGESTEDFRAGGCRFSRLLLPLLSLFSLPARLATISSSPSSLVTSALSSANRKSPVAPSGMAPGSSGNESRRSSRVVAVSSHLLDEASGPSLTQP